MEAVPRLPMVCFELRTPSEATSFGPKLKEYIRSFYNEDPETYTSEIQQLESLRAAAVRPTKDLSGIATLKRYYCQLHFLMSRFPMVKDGSAAIQFSWRDVYVGISFAVADVRYEISSILYNIGALHTQLGMCDTRTTEDGMKMACTHFQCAAWAFQHLKDTHPPSTEADVAPDIMQFAYHLCLAQAQECILEKSMMDNRKPSIIVKVAVQVVNYYSQAFSALKQSVSEEAVGTRVYTGWRRLAKFKEIYYRCVIQLFQGMQAEEQQKMGERVAFYQLAHDTLEEAIKLSKNLDKSEMNPKQIQESLSFTMDVVEGKRKAAKNENEFIYHEEVPDRDQLPKAMGVALVKGIPFCVDDPEVSGQDIFGRLVPMKAHEASSLYSEEKAKLLRKAGNMIEEKDQLLIGFLSSLQLEYLHCYSEPDSLPQELVDRCAALSAKPNAIQSLIDSMAKLSDTCVEVENMLQEIDELLQEEATCEKEYQTLMGKRPPSIVATDMTREAAKYKEAHSKANESNQALHKVMTTHISNLRILSLPLNKLHQQIPPPPSISDKESDDIVKEMQALIEKVEEMRNQRSMLASQLRESICKDDITQLLVTHQNENVDTLFEQELKKHEDVVKLIQQNLAAQDNILKAVTDAYARYSSVRKSTAEAVKRRQSVVNALISCFDAYEDLLAKSEKGHEFYNKLETNVSKLLLRVRSTCKVQQEERQQLLEKNMIAPKKILKKDSNITDIPSSNLPRGPAAPKLKDYLKKDGGIALGGFSEASSLPYPSSASVGLYGQISPSLAPARGTGYYDSTAGVIGGMANMSVDSASPNWMPGVRPAPLGSEATSSILKSEPSEKKELAYISPAPPPVSVNYNTGSDQTQYSQQAYSYAGTWGYGSHASTMSTYLPANVQYPSDFKFNPSESANMASIYRSDQEYRYGPAGAAAYPTGQQQASLASSYSGVAPSQSSLSSEKISENLPSSCVLNKGVMNHPTGMFGSTQQDQSSSSGNGGHEHSYDQTPSALNAHHPNTPSGYHDPAAYSSGYQSGYSGSNGYQTPLSIQVQYAHAYPTSQQVVPGFNPTAHYLTGYAGSTAITPSNDYLATATPNVFSHPYSAGSWPVQQNVASNPIEPSAIPGYQVAISTDSSHFQYMENQNASYYSSAGNYPTNQTSSSYSSNTQTYAYNVDPVESVNNYYQAPYYGSQNPSNGLGTNESAVHATTEVPPPPPQQQQQQQPYSQGMYMQARMPNSDPCTTDSPQSSRSSFSEKGNSSNIDLLAGLDFSISQQPLIPQPGLILSEPSSVPSVSAGSHEVLEQSKESTIASLNEVNELSSLAFQSDEKLEMKSESASVLQSSSDGAVKVQTLKSVKDPFPDAESLSLFTQEVEKYEKFVEGLTSKTLNGPTTLDMKWKELTELQEKDMHKRSISVARCYPMKNRFSDILPYDCSRVELPSTKDDYINASILKDLTLLTPPFIMTQAPLPSTYTDFWTMVYEHQVEVVVCLLSDMELEGQVYWPNEKGQEISAGRMRLSLQTSNTRQHWVERILSLSDVESRISRVIIHLQFVAWPGSSFPSSPGPFLGFVSECLAFHSQQRVTAHPVLVHCWSGVGRSGLFCLIAAALCEIQAGHGLVDLVKLSAAMSERRKNALRDREHLKFAYQSVLYYAQDLLMKHPANPCKTISYNQAAWDLKKCDDHSTENVERKTSSPSFFYEKLQSIENPSPKSSNSISPYLTDLSQLSIEVATKNVHLSKKGQSRFTAEHFKKTGLQIGSSQSSDDPFSGIDPLWPLKR